MIGNGDTLFGVFMFDLDDKETFFNMVNVGLYLLDKILEDESCCITGAVDVVVRDDMDNDFELCVASIAMVKRVYVVR